MSKKYCLLANRTVIQISGPESTSFLQGITTNDMLNMSDGDVKYCAMLTPQGKIFADFIVLYHDNSFLLDIHSDILPDFIDRLKMYKLRAKVEINEDCGYQSYACSCPAIKLPKENIEGAIFQDPRYDNVGNRAILKSSRIFENHNYKKWSLNDYERLRIDAGLPEMVIDAIKGRSFPLELGLEELNGIDFNKGCYVGQEVTARTKHKGVVRKKIYKLQAEEGMNLQKDSHVKIDEKEIGIMRSVSGNLGIAILKVEDAEKTDFAKASGVKVKLVKPNWH